MEIKKTWTAISKPEKSGEDNELINMAGQWNVGIIVSISRPHSYFQGPVEKIEKEIHTKESREQI